MTQSVNSQMAQGEIRNENSSAVANNSASGNKVIFTEKRGNYWVVFVLDNDSKEKANLLWFKDENTKGAMRYCFVLRKQTGLRISHHSLSRLSNAIQDSKNKEELYIDGVPATPEEVRAQEEENMRLASTGEAEDVMMIKRIEKKAI